MDKAASLTMEHFLFCSETIGEVAILTFKDKPLLHVSNLEAKSALFDYLDCVSAHDNIKVLLIKSAAIKMTSAEYINYYAKINTGHERIAVERLYTTIDQFVLKLADLNKLVVHAESGNAILLFMNVSLACDYRIVADNTIYQNPNIEMDIVPKGGGVFYLSKMLGTHTASRVLYSKEDITAVQAQQMGIVDKIVPLQKLEEMALTTAQKYAQLPSGYASGIKKLLNFNLRELGHYLQFEDNLLRRQIRSCRLQNFGKLDGTL